MSNCNCAVLGSILTLHLLNFFYVNVIVQFLGLFYFTIIIFKQVNTDLRVPMQLTVSHHVEDVQHTSFENT